MAKGIERVGGRRKKIPPCILISLFNIPTTSSRNFFLGKWGLAQREAGRRAAGSNASDARGDSWKSNRTTFIMDTRKIQTFRESQGFQSGWHRLIHPLPSFPFLEEILWNAKHAKFARCPQSHPEKTSQWGLKNKLDLLPLFTLAFLVKGLVQLGLNAKFYQSSSTDSQFLIYVTEPLLIFIGSSPFKFCSVMFWCNWYIIIVCYVAAFWCRPSEPLYVMFI